MKYQAQEMLLLSAEDNDFSGLQPRLRARWRGDSGDMLMNPEKLIEKFAHQSENDLLDYYRHS